MMYAIVIGCSGAIAMSLTVLKKASSKTMEQVVVITVHKFSYVNRVDFFFDRIHKQKQQCNKCNLAAPRLNPNWNEPRQESMMMIGS